MENPIGKKLGEYLIEEHLGTGGFGSVYKVSKQDDGGKYIYALKHITFPTPDQYNDVLITMNNSEADADEYFKTMLKDVVSEFNSMRDLSGKNSKYFVNYYDHQILGTPKQYDILIRMELLTPFTSYCKVKSLTVADVIRLGIEIGEALDICHAKKIIHRDVKEANIFVNNDGDFKLGDFGVAKTVDKTTQMMSRKGTPFYMAPEILLNKSYSANIDIYALAMVLYKLLNKGRYPFMPPFPQKYSNIDLENAQATKLKGVVPDRPFSAGNVLGDVLVKSLSGAKVRFAKAADFVAALKQAQESMTDKELKEVVSEPQESGLTQKSVVYKSIFEGEETQATIGLTKAFSGEADAEENINVFDLNKKRDARPSSVFSPDEKKEIHDKEIGKANYKEITSLKIYDYIIPFVSAVLFVLFIDITARDIMITNSSFLNSMFLRITLLIIFAAVTIFFIARIIILPDKKTLSLAAESKKWKEECLEILKDTETFISEKTFGEEANNGYRNLRGEFAELAKRIDEISGFWNITVTARQFEPKITAGLKELEDLIKRPDYFNTISYSDEFKTTSDTKKSELGLMANKVKRLIEQREANLYNKK